MADKTQKEAEKKTFVEVFTEGLSPFIVKDLANFEQPDYAVKWVKDLINTTVPGGKMNRGLTVLDSLRHVVDRELTEKEIEQANIIGWCIEWLQAMFLVADDIMDDSLTRRGLPCWYRQPHPLTDGTEGIKIGTTAINDSFILESCIYRVLKHNFRQEKYYVDILDLFHEVTYQTELGQLLDLTSQIPGKVDLNLFSMERYKLIVKYKTAFYSFYLPIASALFMAGIADDSTLDVARSILIPMGEYFQIQDDFLDCYGDPAVIGKVGRDIEENKCGWLINQALLICTPEQRGLFEKHYGIDNAEDVKVVKQIFSDLDLTSLFRAYEDKSYVELKTLIEGQTTLPQDVFLNLLTKIYKRSV
eukprot:TRINITY_DN10933_c0_g1_i1.p1 TRINITY_DN10933_c0_g1~~TRINITY_DN10933_c0_g1_i1.p1  ORF type:complete len:378 (-),score=96.35 TRINITY_DN10933_c0_g1_i1:118-1197(-)